MNNETIAKILAEFRAFALRAAEEDKMVSPESVLLLADRIEAAEEREQADPLAKPDLSRSCKHLLPEGCEICGCAEYEAAARDQAPPEEPSSGTKPGNAAALREALRGVRQYVRVWIGTDVIDRTMAERIVATCDAALAAPARNCDVGTAEEQWDRYTMLCATHPYCSKCPVKPLWNFEKGRKPSCGLIWAQMPYKKGGAE